MKKRILMSIALILVFTFVLTACGKSEPTEEATTINLPVVEGGDEVETAPEVVPVTPTEEPVASIQDAYPIGQEPAVIMFDPAIAYPIDPASPNYDTEMEEYLTLLMGEAHDFQFLLDKDLTAEQWREFLTNSDHIHLQLSEGAMQAVIEWLISK